MRKLTFLYAAPAVLLGGVFFAGCDSGSDEPAASGADAASSADETAGGDHSHLGEGPHGGSIIDLGHGDYHAELVHDADADSVAVYLLDSSAVQDAFSGADHLTVNLVTGAGPEQFRLAPSPQPGDPTGKTSRFVSVDEKLHALLRAGLSESGSKGRLLVAIDGRFYNGDLHQIHAGHGHSHTGDDALVWRRKNIRHQGFQIRLGHHGKELHAGRLVEPAVSITQGGKPVPDAQVFHSLLAADGQAILAAEAGTVYEPPTNDEPAHYAQAKLRVPPDVDRVVIRYRIVLPGGGGAVSYNVPLDVAK